MCGVVGIVAHRPVNQEIFDALTLSQHRGQDAAGMVTCEGEYLHLRKGNGLVRDVFRMRHMMRLQGNMGIGHIRYPTAGSSSEEEAQPFYVNSPYGITLAHNGNLTNAEQLKHDLLYKDFRHLNTGSDSEIILNIFADALQERRKVTFDEEDIFHAVHAVHQRCQGAYAVVAMLTGFGVVAFRDPNGIRPLIYGRRSTPEGDEYMVASESVVLNVLGYTSVADVMPGEAIFIRPDGTMSKRQCSEKTSYSPCIFEYIYLARPDSFIDNISVYKFRLKLGEYLARRVEKVLNVDDIDVVMPIPETSRTAATVVARSLGKKYREGFVKNNYVGRTFIMPGQQTRRKSVRQKLNTINLEFRDKNVLLVDDSIVRGTTSKEIITMARQAGAKKVFFASAAPEVRYPNVYGIDMPAAEELIAHGRTVEEIRELIGADGLVFQELKALYDAAHEGNPEITRFEDSVFTGDYLTGSVTEAYLQRLAEIRNDKAKQHVEID